MSYQEKNIYSTISITVIVFSLYCIKMYLMYQGGLFNTPDATRLAGKSILILIAVMALVNFVVQAVLSALNTQETKNCTTPVLDERDKSIELKGMQLSYAITGGSVIIAMITLTLGWPSFLVFNLIIFGLITGEIVGNIIKLRTYNNDY